VVRSGTAGQVLHEEGRRGGGAGERAVRPATAERRAGLRQAVELFIDRRLDLVERGVPLYTGELTPASMAAAHAISPRGLHQLFEDRAEPVTRRVRRLRLERARGQLLRGHGSVTAVAARWGFPDPSHFARAYREEFGEAPRDTLLGSAH
jgi:AraC-like DNA-binding protein